MRRAQKPFTVEVKRGRKGAAAKQSGDSSPKVETVAPKESAASNPAPAAVSQPRSETPARRILQAIEQPSSGPISAVAPDRFDAEPIVANATSRRGRGRPPKSDTVVADDDTARKAPDKGAEVPVRKRAPAIVAVADLRIAIKDTPAYVSHDDRAEAANSLPRGERWKRRLPKALW